MGHLKASGGNLKEDCYVHALKPHSTAAGGITETAPPAAVKLPASAPRPFGRYK
jgi:hypothetical protein